MIVWYCYIASLHLSPNHKMFNTSTVLAVTSSYYFVVEFVLSHPMDNISYGSYQLYLGHYWNLFRRVFVSIFWFVLNHSKIVLICPNLGITLEKNMDYSRHSHFHCLSHPPIFFL